MAYGGRSQLKMSEETFDFVCTACAEDSKRVEAVKYCVECVGYCCEPCVDTHTQYPPLRKHNLMDVSQGNLASGQQSQLLEIPTERCSKHKGKVLDMSCEGHNVVGCSTCFVKDHKSCPDSQIHSIPDMIDTLFNPSDCKQTHSLLRDMMASMTHVSKSKDTQLRTLNKSKKEALDKVTTFEKALVVIVRKAAESSRKGVETAYKTLETDILQEKHTVDSIRNDLQTTDTKLSQLDENRGQKFACSKLAQEKIKAADSETKKQELQHHTDPQITFVPDQQLMEYIKALQGIGQVETHERQTHDIVKKQTHDTVKKQKDDLVKKQKDDLVKKQKDDLYRIKGSSNINIKLSDDTSKCYYRGCCLTPDNQLLVTDVSNKKLKRIDLQTMSVIDYCTLDSAPRGVCCISKHEVAVACVNNKKIQFVSIQGKMSPTRRIKMSHRCYGITFNDGKLYVTDWDKSLYVYSMTGSLLNTISQDNAGKYLFTYSRHVTFSESGDRMFVGGGWKGLVCFDGMGNYLSTVTDTDLDYADGTCMDGRGNVFVVGSWSHNVIQFSDNGKKVGVVVKLGDGLGDPYSVCFLQGLNRMFVTMWDSSVVKMYELE